MKIWCVAVLGLLAGCSQPVAPGHRSMAARSTSADLRSRFAAYADAFCDAYFERHPTFAVSLGLHQHDGLLPDVSSKALDSEIAWLRRAESILTKFEHLSAVQEVERSVLLFQVRRDLFSLTRLRAPWRNPMTYAGPLDLVPYVSRDYRPLSERAKAVRSVFRTAPDYLRQARRNLVSQIPKTWIHVALIQFRGLLSFAQKDLDLAFAKLDKKALEALRSDRKLFVSALQEMVAFLEERQAQATDKFALGDKLFLEMLEQSQGLRINLGDLDRVARADLGRNTSAMRSVAKEIDPHKPVRSVIASVLAEKPAISDLYRVATEQGVRLRKFLAEKDLVTIPSDKTAVVRPTPPFMRYNSAFLSTAGVFEKKNLPSFYYISPPNPKWSPAAQRAYVPATHDLLFVTVHELWPGHFLDHLHIARNPSRVLKSFWGYARGEGWAHYAEELMVEEGVAGGDPKVRIGQLANALLRNVRFVAAIGLHTKGMTVDRATDLFERKAFTDKATAREQAVRGTFDPMYLSYTLGKLMIMKLRNDWRRKKGSEFSLKKFHDTFLGCCGSAPIPVIRRHMLGDNAGPVLTTGSRPR